MAYTSRDIILALSKKGNGDWNYIYEFISNRQKLTDEEIKD